MIFFYISTIHTFYRIDFRTSLTVRLNCFQRITANLVMQQDSRFIGETNLIAACSSIFWQFYKTKACDQLYSRPALF